MWFTYFDYKSSRKDLNLAGAFRVLEDRVHEQCGDELRNDGTWSDSEGGAIDVHEVVETRGWRWPEPLSR